MPVEQEQREQRERNGLIRCEAVPGYPESTIRIIISCQSQCSLFEEQPPAFLIKYHRKANVAIPVDASALNLPRNRRDLQFFSFPSPRKEPKENSRNPTAGNCWQSSLELDSSKVRDFRALAERSVRVEASIAGGDRREFSDARREHPGDGIPPEPRATRTVAQLSARGIEFSGSLRKQGNEAGILKTGPHSAGRVRFRSELIGPLVVYALSLRLLPGNWKHSRNGGA